MSEKIERLEDLPLHLIEAMLTIASEKVDTDYDTVYKPLFEAGLVDYDELQDDTMYGVDILTERGAALVDDYQRRQGAASLKDFDVLVELSPSPETFINERQRKEQQYGKRLVNRAAALNCSVELVAFIERLEDRIRELENTLEQ